MASIATKDLPVDMDAKHVTEMNGQAQGKASSAADRRALHARRKPAPGPVLDMLLAERANIIGLMNALAADLHVAEPLSIPDGHDGACIKAHTAKGCGWKFAYAQRIGEAVMDAVTSVRQSAPNQSSGPAARVDLTDADAIVGSGAGCPGSASPATIISPATDATRVAMPCKASDWVAARWERLGNSAQNPAHSPSSREKMARYEKQQHIPESPFFSRAPDAASGRPLSLEPPA